MCPCRWRGDDVPRVHRTYPVDEISLKDGINTKRRVLLRKVRRTLQRKAPEKSACLLNVILNPRARLSRYWKMCPCRWRGDDVPRVHRTLRTEDAA